MRRGRRGACLVVASLVVLLAGCGRTVEGGGHASAPATVGSKRSLDRSSVEASDGLRARTAAAASAAGSYRATTTVTYADTVRTTLLVAVAEVELRDGVALHETVQQDGVNSEIVLADGQFYVNLGETTGGGFVHLDPTEAQEALGVDAESLLDEVDTFRSLDDVVPAIRTFRRGGASVHVDGVLCQPYEIGLDRDALARAGSLLLGVDPADTKLVAALPAELTYRVWVGVEDDLVREFSLEFEGLTIETLYTRWGDDFAVTAPPVVTPTPETV